MFSTYRARLILYTVLMLAFLMATLSYTYFYSRDAILEQAETNLLNTTRLLTGNIEMEENELLRYAEIVRDDPRIQEYMFMTAKVGVDGEAMANLFERNFGWLPVERFVFTDINGDVLLGNESPDLAHAVQEHLKSSKNEIFYFQGSKGLELVAWAKITYQGSPLGIVAVTHILNSSWLIQHRTYSGGHLFIEQNNIVQLSTLPQSEGKTFLPHQGNVAMDNDIYSVRAIPLSGEGKKTPHLWHGLSEKELLAQLEKHSQIVLILAVIGSIATLGMGLMVVRNFNRPLTQLMQITQAVAQGSLPMMGKSTETNEIDMLSNRFSEMLQALREKQDEIDNAHKQLKESAITDALTGLYNRRYLKQVFPKLLAQAQRDDHCLCGLMLDLDYFKEINDRHGHLAGDFCLSHLANLLKEFSRASDYVFRVGGEEFLILSLNDNTSGGVQLAEKIRSSLEHRPCTFKTTLITMTTSIGIGFTDNSLQPESALTNLLFHADKALYTAKHNGRNQVVSYDNQEAKNIKPVRDAIS